MKYKILLFLIVILAAVFRFHGLNWDQGEHLHPDERAIVMYTLQLQFPSSISQFFSIQSPWNPHFFAYGSLPLYLLKLTSMLFTNLAPYLTTYDGINLLGRAISATFDLITIIFIYLLGKTLKGYKEGLMAAFFYSISVFPIQTSHFYAVDTLLTCFITITIYLLIKFYANPSLLKAILIGTSIAFAMATKISATVIGVSVIITLLADFFLLIANHPFHPKKWLYHLPNFIFNLCKYSLSIVITLLVVYFILEPYAFIDFNDFINQTLQQDAMTTNAFTFPYTLQYVGIPPYFYEIKNIFLWGLGPLLAILAFTGTLYVTYISLLKIVFQSEKPYKYNLSSNERVLWANELIILIFFWVYFFIVGKFAIGFMRYMLPLYPLLCLFAAIFLQHLIDILKYKYVKKIHKSIFLTVQIIIFILFLVWPISFIQIYSQPNTRVQATEYINQNIPVGTGIAVEHWDDELPLGTASNYQMQTLPLYDPDTQQKWISIINQLQQVQYLVIASNRLYIPIQNLGSCKKYPFPHCYPVASIYYKNLFAGKPLLQNTPYANTPGARNLVFKEIKQFLVTPQIPILNIPINDQSADESFTVYDHPKVMIFKKVS